MFKQQNKFTLVPNDAERPIIKYLDILKINWAID